MPAPSIVVVFGPPLPGRAVLRSAIARAFPNIHVIERELPTADDRVALLKHHRASGLTPVFVAWDCSEEQARREVHFHYAGLPSEIAARRWREFEADRLLREPPADEVAPLVTSHAGEPVDPVVDAVGALLGRERARDVGPLPRVLVVDDDDLGREALAEALEELGCRVAQASSAEAALDAIGRAQGVAGDAFDLVISDQHMGGASGTELAERLAGVTPRPRFAILTAHAEKSMRDLLRAAGVELVLTKPIAGTDLVNLVNELSGSNA